MSLSTYDDIYAAVVGWINRRGYAFVEDRSDEFIEMAQRRIMRQARIPPMEVVTTLTVDSSGEATVPTDYLEAKYVVASTGSGAWPLQPAPFHTVKGLQDSASFSKPQMFDVEGGTFYIGAVPVSETITLVYYKELEFISSSVATNWFSSYAPETILYGALSEAALFMKEADLAKAYEKKFEQAMQALKTQKDRGEYAGSPLSVTAR